jgi:protease secretion system membrane fusion protein
VNTDARAFQRAGWLIVLLGVGGFLLWGLLAPLDKGVPLMGTVAKESNRKAIQHQTGGTVKEILVKDGDVVKAGQVLVRMNGIVAQVGGMKPPTPVPDRARHRGAPDRRTRRSKTIKFPAELEQRRSDPRVADLMSLQSQLLASRQMSLQNELGSVDENIAGLKNRSRAWKNRATARRNRWAFLKEQLGGMRDLAKEGYVARNRLLDLERTYAQLSGARLGRHRQHRPRRARCRTGLRRAQRAQDYQKEVRTQLSDTEREAEALSARLEGQKFEVDNVEVKSPVRRHRDQPGRVHPGRRGAAGLQDDGHRADRRPAGGRGQPGGQPGRPRASGPEDRADLLRLQRQQDPAHPGRGRAGGGRPHRRRAHRQARIYKVRVRVTPEGAEDDRASTT